jgi:hypothetical protein
MPADKMPCWQNLILMATGCGPLIMAGTAEDMGKAVAVSGEYVYLCGHTYSHSGIAAYAYQNTIGGNGDALLAKFDVFGNFYWATYAGGYWDEFGRTIHILNDETIIFGGKTFSWDYPCHFWCTSNILWRGNGRRIYSTRI